MNFFLRNKYHFIALTTLIFLFMISVFVRKENMAEPLTRHHEWITAHTLITCDVWAQNGGPSAYHFSPVYTYPGKGNVNRKMLGGIVDEKGDVYYVSYPPFAFLFAYYATQIIGGPTIESIRTLNLALHFLCAIFIYLIAHALSPKEQKNALSIAGLFGGFLYLFSAGNLWFHGNLYSADMLVQLFIISGIYFSIRFFKKEYKNERLFLSVLFFLFFLATYTEWLGLFLAFTLGIAFMLTYFVKREIRFLKGFFVVAIASGLALVITIGQYSAIAGWEELKTVSIQKYKQRSGHEAKELTPNSFNLENDEAFDFIIDKVDLNYKMAENFIGIFVLIFVALIFFRKIRSNISNPTYHWLILLIVTGAVLMHYYLFFNFNALHDFSSLKTGFLLTLTLVVIVSLLEHGLIMRFKILLAIVIIILGIDEGIESVQCYKSTYPIADTEWFRVRTGEAMQTYGHPDKAIFMNISRNPELVYYAKHSVFPIQDSTTIIPMMGYFGETEGQYYHHEGTELKYMVEFVVVNDSIVFDNANRIDF